MSEARRFDLREAETDKPIGRYTSEDGAVDKAASILSLYGREAVLDLTLTYEDPDGMRHVLADGEALPERVKQRAA